MDKKASYDWTTIAIPYIQNIDHPNPMHFTSIPTVAKLLTDQSFWGRVIFIAAHDKPTCPPYNKHFTSLDADGPITSVHHLSIKYANSHMN